MKHLSKILVSLFFLAMMGTFYLWSVRGMGVEPLRSPKVMQQIQKNCPNGQINNNGDCMRSSFRSIYFIRTGYTAGTGK